MFTGIITDVGRIRSIEGATDKQFVFETGYDLSSVDIGASIACNGVCLTVVDKGTDYFGADVSAKTISVTTVNSWQKGHEVNLERSLKLGDELGGHIVTGHVDCVGKITRFDRLGESITLNVAVSSEHKHLIAKKGSITINGASLTVNAVTDRPEECEFSINLIPHTQNVTSFRSCQLGDKVNIEFDVLARYVSRLKMSL
ncbi:riboflavin synthase [Kordiimonas aquimaris]|uniref:riboflavin synthase n=1 Tax=Kordiimonas aquimaris TaxID=707591 RepID=UPI0021D2C78F|nr:riboflavin synthase [Kordiimonas aquimaris]